ESAPAVQALRRRQMQGFGEDAADSYLRGLGYEILARNWSTKMGELDLVARNDQMIVFVEVKARAGESFVPAEQCVDYRKQVKLRRTAQAFLATHRSREAEECRFDVIAVVTSGQRPVIRHIENAF
ncbi:MAG: YraN family protein, partial [Actinomycetota bacterium]